MRRWRRAGVAHHARNAGGPLGAFHAAWSAAAPRAMDFTLCGKDVTGYPWNPPWPHCEACLAVSRNDDELAVPRCPMHRRLAPLRRRDPQGRPQQVRVRPQARRDQARPVHLGVGRVPDGIRLRARDDRARRRPARRAGVRVGADVPRLRGRDQGDRAVQDGRREGARRSRRVRAVSTTRAGTRSTTSTTCPSSCARRSATSSTIYKDLDPDRHSEVKGWDDRVGGARDDRAGPRDVPRKRRLLARDAGATRCSTSSCDSSPTRRGRSTSAARSSTPGSWSRGSPAPRSTCRTGDGRLTRRS